MLEMHQHCSGVDMKSIIMEPVIEKHTLPVKFLRSWYISTEFEVNKKLVEQTLENPDKREDHNKDPRKSVLSKRYPEQIGIHGCRGKPCYTIYVIIWKKNNQIVTAFPSL